MVGQTMEEGPSKPVLNRAGEGKGGKRGGGGGGERGEGPGDLAAVIMAG